MTELNKHFFLSGLITIIILNLTPFGNLSFPTYIKLVLNFATFFSGFITIYVNKNLLVNIESERNDEILVEQEKINEFRNKFPKINKIPLFRNVARFIYIEKWWYSLSIILLLVIGFVIRLYNLGELSLWWDELLTGTYVTRILETGLPISPSGFEYYWRGISYHYLVSGFTFIFGNTEFWLRFPSVLLGIGTIILSFLITKRINKILALFIVIILTFSIYNVEYSQFARFYIMNAFLFLLNIEFFWRGFFEQKKWFKVLSIITFLIMILTVQLGSIFISVIFYYLIYKISLIKIKKSRIRDLFSLKLFIPIMLFLSLYITGNPFDLIGIYKDHPYEVDLISQVDGNVRYILPKIPYPEFKNIVLPFFNDFYWPTIFFILASIISLFLIFNKLKLNKELGYSEYILGISFISLILFEFANPFSKEPRLYLMFEPLYIILSMMTIFIIVKEILQLKHKKTLIILSFILLALFFSSKPSLYDVMNIRYGDNVSNDPFRTTWAQAYRSDSKTTLEYLKKNIEDEDIWINTLEPAYFYLQRNPDFILNQNYKWKNMWREEIFTDKDKNYIEIRYNSILINTMEDLQKILNNNTNKNVWLLANGQNLETLYTKQLNKDFVDFLSENTENVVYSSPDERSKLLLFQKLNQSFLLKK